jgi:hypothetical protein
MVILPEMLGCLRQSFALAYRVPGLDAIAKMLWLPSAGSGKNRMEAANRPIGVFEAEEQGNGRWRAA